ncbi:MAG TPA: hypothetical protein VGS11_00585 [Candidatus Bathyarchaeia archaeon]|nr:hypothetical protein [Candidatus Bathyarchaeia archaeon]
MLFGNLAAILVTIGAFLQAVSWSIAGVLILISLILPLLANISQPRGPLTSHPTSKIPTTSHHSQADIKTAQHRPNEKHGAPNHQGPARMD